MSIVKTVALSEACTTTAGTRGQSKQSNVKGRSTLTFLAGGLLFPLWACGAEVLPELLATERFRTAEYRTLWGLDTIGAAQAYALGYTGKGVRVGVHDGGNFLDHPTRVCTASRTRRK